MRYASHRRGTLRGILLSLLVAVTLTASATPPAARQGEHASANFALCRDGAPSCDPRQLSKSERVTVAAFEAGRNFAACATGEGRCDWTRLTDRQLNAVALARVSVAPVPAPPPELATFNMGQTVPAPDVAENGSYAGQLNANGVPKTVHVNGYYRKDGTYVRGHYRSPPNSNPPAKKRKK